MKVLNSFNRSLRSGGILFVSVKKGTGNTIKSYPDGTKRFFHYFNGPEITGKIIAAGFTILDYHEKIDKKDKDVWICVLAQVE